MNRSRLHALLLTLFAAPLVLPLVLSAAVAQQPAAAVERSLSAEQVAEWGHRRRVGEVDVLFLRGTPRQRGVAEGYLFAEELVAAFRDMLNSDLMPVPVPAWSLMVLPRVRQCCDFPERYRERCEGMIDGLRARDAKLLEIPELRRQLTALDMLAVATIPDAAGLACSSFAAWGPLSAGEGTVVGRNLDYRCTPVMLKTTMLKVHARDGDRAAWLEVGWPGVLGLLTGVSEHGVQVAIHDVYVGRGLADEFTPRPVVLQEICERLTPGSGAAVQATAIAREFDMGMGGNAMVAWAGAQPGAVVLELNPKAEEQQGVVPRLPEDGDSWVVCTNDHWLPAARVGLEGSPQCWRFQRLVDGLSASDAPARDYAASWELIGEPEVDDTLYQTVADLGAMQFGVRMRRKPDAEVWDRVDGLDVTALCREAAAGPQPVGSGASAGDGGK